VYHETHDNSTNSADPCCGVFKYYMYLNTKSAQKVFGQSI